MRRLSPPTWTQQLCQHTWQTHTTRPGKPPIYKVRYLRCDRCGLRVKSEERLIVGTKEGR
jgi:hypothetical protein